MYKHGFRYSGINRRLIYTIIQMDDRAAHKHTYLSRRRTIYGLIIRKKISLRTAAFLYARYPRARSRSTRSVTSCYRPPLPPARSPRRVAYCLCSGVQCLHSSPFPRAIPSSSTAKVLLYHKQYNIRIS